MENETLEEVRKRTERLELMMGLMLEQSSKTELAAFATTRQRSHSPRSTIGTDEHSSESQDGGQGFDMDYAMSARFLPLEKLLKPAKIAWADPLAALEMEDHWSEICEM